jgi:hypothetical protein
MILPFDVLVFRDSEGASEGELGVMLIVGTTRREVKEASL